MTELSTLITLGYLVVGVLVIRRLFKYNRTMRCASCKKYGTMLTVDKDNEMFILEQHQDILDAEQINTNHNHQTLYKCSHCKHITSIH